MELGKTKVGKKTVTNAKEAEEYQVRPSEDEKSCDTCKHNTESWDSDACDGCCGANSKWSGEIYPGEFEVMEYNGRLDALKSEEQVIDNIYKIKEVTMPGFSSFNPKLQSVGDVKAFNDALDMAIEVINKCDKIEKIINSNDNDFVANYVRGLFAGGTGMSNEEHYFENLIFLGKDCNGEPNKSALSKEVQEAIETCYRYLICNKDSIIYKLNEDLS